MKYNTYYICHDSHYYEYTNMMIYYSYGCFFLSKSIHSEDTSHFEKKNRFMLYSSCDVAQFVNWVFS